MNTEKQYFSALTGIRAAAALMVFWHHANPVPAYLPHLRGFFSELYVGVSFFFVLSGLLIGLRYSDKTVSWKKYFVFRAARIYPMWFIITIITFIAGYNIQGNFAGLLFFNLTFLKGFNEHIAFTGVDQGWTLTVEECFYFLAPLLILLLSKKKYLAFILSAVFIALGLMLSYFYRILGIDIFQNINFIFEYTIFGRSWEFLFGLLLALLYKKHSEKIKAWYNNFHGINWILCFCIIGIIYTMYLVREPGQFAIASTPGIILNNFILPVFTGAFYLGLMVTKDFFAKILSSSIAVLGGKASYIFYLIHIGVIREFLSFYIDAVFPDNIYRWLAKNLTLIIISIAMYYLLEEPLNRGVKRWLLGEQKIGNKN